MTTPSISSSSELPLCEWLLNYQDKIAEYGQRCSLGAAEIAATIADIKYYIFLQQELSPNMLEETEKYNDYKQLMIYGHGQGSLDHPLSSSYPHMPPIPAPGIQKRLLEQIARIKTSAHYTEALGQELGISSAKNIASINSTKQSIGVGNRVRQDIMSYDYEGVWIESHLNGADWAFFDE